MTDPMRFLRVNIPGHVTLNEALEPGKVHIEISDSLGAPGLRWLVTPCDEARLRECTDAAIAHYHGDASIPPPAEPPPVETDPPPPEVVDPVTAPVVSISNAAVALVTLSEADFAKFSGITDVTIAGNSCAAANGIVTLANPDPVGFTYDIGLDLSLEVAPGTGGTITENVAQSAAAQSEEPRVSASAGAEPLKDRRKERFAQEMAKGSSQSDAAIAAGYKKGKGIRAQASRLLTDANIVNRVDWLIAQAAAQTTITLASGTEAFLRIAKLAESQKTPAALNVASTAIYRAMEVNGLVVHKSETIHERRLEPEQLDAILDEVNRELTRRQGPPAAPAADGPARTVPPLH